MCSTLLGSGRDGLDGPTHHGCVVAHRRRRPYHCRDRLLPVSLRGCPAPHRRTDHGRGGRGSYQAARCASLSEIRTCPSVSTLFGDATRDRAPQATGHSECFARFAPDAVLRELRRRRGHRRLLLCTVRGFDPTVNGPRPAMPLWRLSPLPRAVDR